MRPDVLVGPSEWVVEQFGDRVAGELWTRVPEALSTAIDREVSAHPAMTTTTERVLANPRWPLPYEELVLFLGTLPGAEIIRVLRPVGADVHGGRTGGPLLRPAGPRTAAPLRSALAAVAGGGTPAARRRRR